MRRFVLCAVLSFLASCSSLDSRLYDEGPPPVLRNGTIEMKSSWERGEGGREDVRRISAKDGVITCDWESPRHESRHGVVSEDDWVALWKLLYERRAFGPTKELAVREDHPKGGVYHLIDLELDGVRHSLSAQYAPDIFFFTTRDVTERVQISNRIAEVVSNSVHEDDSTR